MNENLNVPRLKSGKQRIRELREKRTKPSVAESISNQRSMILINIVIEIATGIILVVGLYYLVQFLMFKRADIEPFQYKLSMGCIAVFTFGWLTYLSLKVRANILRFRKTSVNK
ncbi:MAG: hypothetical protein JXB48_11925 [Candidatus Latescibacteria bacterium]|nr:hypothetical protein [Candidatus Latescibacterota bacterium]